MKISIITINYNNIDGLKKTTESIINQKIKPEWIIIDGGSNDGSYDFINNNKKHLFYWVSEPDTGIYNAMNKGLMVATGEYYLFLNSGDTLADNFVIKNLYKYLESNKPDVLYGNAIIVDNENKEIKRFIAPSSLTLSYFFGNTLNHQATLFSRKCFSNYKYNENNRIASDVELFIHLILYNYKFEYIDYYICRFNNQGISSKKNMPDEFQSIIQRLIPKAILIDYNNYITYKDIDLYKIIKRIIDSNRIIRNITRLLIYPIYIITKFNKFNND